MKLLFGDLSTQQIEALQRSMEQLPRRWDGTMLIPYHSDRRVQIIDLGRPSGKPRCRPSLYAHTRH